MNILLNECLIFGFIKLKEFKNARSLAKECQGKLSKQGIFHVSKEDLDGGIPFPVSFLSSLALYSESNSKNKQSALIELYGLER